MSRIFSRPRLLGTSTTVSCAKTEELFEIPFGMYRVVQKSEATTFEGSDLCMPTSSKCPNVYDEFYEYGVNRCIQNITALK